MSTNKLIRECRMGNPKTFKTGAVAGTYPKPMLYFGFDRGGLDVIPSKGAVTTPTLVKMDTTFDEIVFIKPEEIGTWLLKPMSEQPKILAIDFAAEMPKEVSLDLVPAKSSVPLTKFVTAYNQICQRQVLPWKTILFDSVTGFTDAVLSHISSFNPSAMADARQWASMAGGKVRQTVLSMTALPAHTVFLVHGYTEKSEISGTISQQPNVYSQTLRDDFFGLFSQVFYSTKKLDGTPIIWPSDKYPVAGIGPRWPQGLPQECQPDFTSIYGKDVV